MKLLISKFLAVGSKPTAESFPELPYMIVWFRALLGLAFGIALGGTRGGVKFVFGLNIITFIPILYAKVILVADMESYKQDLQFKGVLNALALAMLVWIYCYTWTNAEAEATMGAVAAVIRATALGRVGSGDTTVMEAAAVSDEPLLGVDSEF